MALKTTKNPLKNRANAVQKSKNPRVIYEKILKKAIIGARISPQLERRHRLRGSDPKKHKGNERKVRL
jgi:hypothetical protein